MSAVHKEPRWGTTHECKEYFEVIYSKILIMSGNEA